MGFGTVGKLCKYIDESCGSIVAVFRKFLEHSP